MNKILIIEDEPGLQMTLTDFLESEEFEVAVRGDGVAGQAEAETGNWDIILLDVMLPGRDGFQVCQNLRGKGIETPILMLTARGTNIDTVMGLRLGADDYLTKPFDSQVLLARIHALLRRASRTEEALKAAGATAAGLNGNNSNRGLTLSESGCYTFGDFSLDTRRGELFIINGKDDLAIEEPVELNTQEYRLLLYFLQNEGRILTRDELLDGVWGYDRVTTTRTVDVHVAWLRQKLGEQSRPVFIQTIRGRGYKFAVKSVS